MMRVGCYVDGFNLYHAIDALKEPQLKWLDLKSLAGSYLRPEHKLERVVYFTAVTTWDAQKRARHLHYIKAVQHTGVEVLLARFDRVKKHCRKFDQFCKFDQEKQTDVNLAVEILSDCYDSKIDRILLVTADSDHVPLLKRLRQRFPAIKIFLIAPPRRLGEARELGSMAHNRFELTAGRLREHLLPRTIKSGHRIVATCPASYVK
jgi:uncharacterized LabA/DUF88 family protein